MKILMLTLYLPYPTNSGGQIRSYNLIKHLSKKHEITLVSFIKKGEEKYAKEMEKFCKEVIYFYRTDKPFTLKNILKTAFSRYPFLVIRNFSAEGKKALAKKISKEKYDLIHVETFYLRPHIPDHPNIPIVLVDQTIEYQVYQHFAQTTKWWFLRPFFNLEIAKLKYWEAQFWKEANRVVAVSEADKTKMQELVSGLRVDIIPNAPGEDMASLYEYHHKKKFKKPVVFFQSNFLWLQNIEAAELLANEVFPKIKEAVPEVICRIVGQSASKVQHLANKDVEIIDLASDDVKGVVRSYKEGDIFIAPLKGPGGTRLKIFAAMTAGVPVVATSVGAGGIEIENGKNILIADTPEELTKATVKLIKDHKFYLHIMEDAKKLIKEKYDWAVFADKLSDIYEETAKK